MKKNGQYYEEILSVADEVNAVEAENRVRKQMRLEERTHYGGINVYGKEIKEIKGYKGYYTLVNKPDYAEITEEDPSGLKTDEYILYSNY